MSSDSHYLDEHLGGNVSYPKVGIIRAYVFIHFLHLRRQLGMQNSLLLVEPT